MTEGVYMAGIFYLASVIYWVTGHRVSAWVATACAIGMLTAEIVRLS